MTAAKTPATTPAAGKSGAEPVGDPARGESKLHEIIADEIAKALGEGEGEGTGEGEAQGTGEGGPTELSPREETRNAWDAVTEALRHIPLPKALTSEGEGGGSATPAAPVKPEQTIGRLARFFGWADSEQ